MDFASLVLQIFFVVLHDQFGYFGYVLWLNDAFPTQLITELVCVKQENHKIVQHISTLWPLITDDPCIIIHVLYK